MGDQSEIAVVNAHFAARGIQAADPSQRNGPQAGTEGTFRFHIQNSFAFGFTTELVGVDDGHVRHPLFREQKLDLIDRSLENDDVCDVLRPERKILEIGPTDVFDFGFLFEKGAENKVFKIAFR